MDVKSSRKASGSVAFFLKCKRLRASVASFTLIMMLWSSRSNPKVSESLEAILHIIRLPNR
jgi:hypothetical protein